jgi:hypothetical protein
MFIFYSEKKAKKRVILVCLQRYVGSTDTNGKHCINSMKLVSIRDRRNSNNVINPDAKRILIFKYSFLKTGVAFINTQESR